jgi:AraC-like DNA-binding protein
MAIELTLSPDGPLDFRPGLPDGFAGPLLRGASAYSAKANAAEIIVQDLQGDGYAIRLLIARVVKRVTGIGQIPFRGLYSNLMIKNSIRKEIGSIGKFHIRQDQLSCYFTSPTACKVKFEKSEEYHSIDIFYSPALLEELLPYFPELNNVLQTGEPGMMLRNKMLWTVPSMKEITTQLLNCPYDDSTRQFYFDLKVREFLYQILEHTYKRKPDQLSFTPWEIKKIHDARDILNNHISKKPPLIKWLSKQVALNEYKLKVGFRQYFNSSIFEWLLDKKMQHAKDLILTTNKPVKEVSILVGYPLTTNFITAFRKHFGMTPGTLRRK